MSKEYMATVVRLPELQPLAGMDNVAAAKIFGYQVIVGKDEKPGTLGVFFAAETQLLGEFLRQNNLYRHTDKNADPSKKGFFEDNGRVKAVKFRGHRSDGFWVPLSYLSFANGGQTPQLEEGTVFDEFGGTTICQKYIPKGARMRSAAPKAFARVTDEIFPKHFDTENLLRNLDRIPDEAHIVITQKLHGTSVRIGHLPLPRKLAWYEKLAKKLGVKVDEVEYSYVAGSRNVVKGDFADKTVNEFYGTDIYTLAAKHLEYWNKLPKNYIVYGELIGWTPDGTPIQKGYTYDCARGDMQLYVYRVAFVNPDGMVVDLAWSQVKEFCLVNGLAHVPELGQGYYYSAFAEEDLKWFLDRDLSVDHDCVPLSTDSVCDEGICVRAEGMRPQIYKVKSPMFLQHESKILDSAEPDMEMVG